MARRASPSKNAQTASASECFWKLGCRKSARCCGAKHILKSKGAKHTVQKVHGVVARSAFQSVKTVNNCRFGALLVVEMSRKCTLLWREAHFEVKMLKAPHARTFLDVRSLFCVTGAGESAPCQTRGFCSSFKNDGRRGAFEKDLQRCMSRGRSSTRDMFIRDVRRSGR